MQPSFEALYRHPWTYYFTTLRFCSYTQWMILILEVTCHRSVSDIWTYTKHLLCVYLLNIYLYVSCNLTCIKSPIHTTTGTTRIIWWRFHGSNSLINTVSKLKCLKVLLSGRISGDCICWHIVHVSVTNLITS